MDKNYEYFDLQVDRFLRNQMSEEEATEFMSDLESDVEKKERARIIALMIKSMDIVAQLQISVAYFCSIGLYFLV